MTLKVFLILFGIKIIFVYGYTEKEISSQDHAKKVDPPQTDFNCSYGWKGKGCEKPTCRGVNICFKGECQVKDNRPFCYCDENYSGYICDEVPCTIPELCLNGNCYINRSGIEKCRCHSGYYGERCERFRCDDRHTCVRGACVEEGGLNMCECPKQYTGARCDKLSCDGFECPENTKCMIHSDVVYCVNTNIDFEKNRDQFDCNKPFIKCGPGGTCNSTTNKCDCESGYQGILCDKLDCASPNEKLCDSNNGNCKINSEGKHFCECKSGFTGDDCKKQSCVGDSLCSGNHEDCWIYDGVQTCICKPGFGGKNCEIKICEEMMCGKNGQCYYENGEPKCVCLPGFSGEKCQNFECSSQGACVYGNCTNNVSKEECVCIGGWDGPGCRLADCNTFKSCLRGGVCFIFFNEHYCDCRQTGYGGTVCEANVFTDDSMCKNDADAFFISKDFLGCVCLYFYSGNACNISQKCPTKNICPPGSYCYQMNGIQKCYCPDNKSGVNCETYCTKNCNGGDCLFEHPTSLDEKCSCPGYSKFPYCSVNDFPISVLQSDLKEPTNMKSINFYGFIINRYSKCKNGGQYHEFKYPYYGCICPLNYVGIICHIKCPDNCEPNYCFEINGISICKKYKRYFEPWLEYINNLEEQTTTEKINVTEKISTTLKTTVQDDIIDSNTNLKTKKTSGPPKTQPSKTQPPKTQPPKTQISEIKKETVKQLIKDNKAAIGLGVSFGIFFITTIILGYLLYRTKANA